MVFLIYVCNLSTHPKPIVYNRICIRNPFKCGLQTNQYGQHNGPFVVHSGGPDWPTQWPKVASLGPAQLYYHKFSITTRIRSKSTHFGPKWPENELFWPKKGQKSVFLAYFPAFYGKFRKIP